MNEFKLTPEERQALTAALSLFLADGYNRTRKRIPKHEWNSVMDAVVVEIRAIQAGCGKPISMIGAGLMMILPDPKYPNDSMFRDLVKAGIVHYLMGKLPDIEKEFGIKVQED
jgi:hypothetical protein